jgi:pimeloyl-ACP methyl ester carboxylesterase
MLHEEFARVNGRRVRYLVGGAGWPLVLLHAFPLSADMWRPQLDDPPEGWRCIAPDLRGFGGSAGDAAGSPPVTMDDYAADVEGLLNELEIERAVIGGVSMGGYVTFALFRQAPERFSGFVLADTRASADTPEGRQARRALSAVVNKDGASGVADQMVPKLLGETTRRERPAVEREVRRLISQNSVPAIDGAIHALMGRPDSTPDLARISTPTLVIVGEEDVVTPPSDSELLQRSISRSRLVLLPRTGHLSNVEAPDDFSRALSDFLSSNL